MLDGPAADQAESCGLWTRGVESRGRDYDTQPAGRRNDEWNGVIAREIMEVRGVRWQGWGGRSTVWMMGWVCRMRGRVR